MSIKRKDVEKNFDSKATNRLVHLMRQSAEKKEDMGLLWDESIKMKEARSILKGIEEALLDGADPNPGDEVPLVSVLCAYPFEKSAALLRTIRTAMALGADVERPLAPENRRTTPYTMAYSPIHPLFQMTLSQRTFRNFFSVEEAKRRLDSILPKPKNEMPQRLERLFRPCVPEYREKDCIVVPLLCSIQRHEFFDMLLGLAERMLDDKTRKDIVNEQVRLYAVSEDRPMGMQDAHAWLARHDMLDFLSYCNIGDTPMHQYIKNVHDAPDLLNVVERLVEGGAVPSVRNIYNMTPYGLACMKRSSDTISPFAFGVNERGLNDEFRDGGIVTWAADRIRYSEPNGEWLKCNLGIIENILRAYGTYRPMLDDELKGKIDLILNDTLAHAVVSFKNYSFMRKIVPMLLNAGASPCHSTPNGDPAWLAAVRKYGNCPLTQALVSALPDGYYEERRELFGKYGIKEPAVPNARLSDTKEDIERGI